ncbi:hypothetical protein PAXRUDRAFT_804986 [Paxillus rubicundulus Ve08.2h10]|uniref:Uncharacterized protein n=1 Tax=Paxillus rubicundulus Ve08.2h10 TaxID=930991 RepID=A0A0D0D2K7_9AGAM|nr:hypothetical protein PAXRUDRAFT_804986 [Paxillus rubicundulus Ve08.2h10]
MLPKNFQPVLFEYDHQIWQQEPIFSHFTKLKDGCTRHQVDPVLKLISDKIREDPGWHPVIRSWCHLTIYTIPPLDRAISLFLGVLWQWFLCQENPELGETEARVFLKKQCNNILDQELCVRPKASQVVVDLDSDEEDESSDSEETLEKSSLYGDLSTISPTNSTSTSISVNSGSPLISTTTTTSSTSSSTSPSISNETVSFLHLPSTISSIPKEDHAILLQQDFYSLESSEHHEDEPSIVPLITQRVKRPSKLKFTSDEASEKCKDWAKELEAYFLEYKTLEPSELRHVEENTASGLYDILCAICESDTSMELSAEHLAISSHAYQWKSSFGLILQSWTDAKAFVDRPIKPEPLPTKGRLNAKGFLELLDNLDKEGQFIPAVSFPSSVGFLLYQQSFVAACNTWLYASLEKKGHKMDVDPVNLYSNILSYLGRFKEFDHFQSAQLRCILREIDITRKFNQHVHKEAFVQGVQDISKGSKNKLQKSGKGINMPKDTTICEPCTKCSHLPASEQCTWILQVEQRADARDLVGSIVTCAPAADCIPLSSTTQGEKSQDGEVHDLDPHKDLDLRLSMNDVHGNGNVGGVIFHAFKESTFKEMCENHQAVASHPSVQRGKDADALLATISYAAPHIVNALKEETVQHGLNCLGTTSANIFYCFNYLSPQHFDHDATESQLKK